MKLNSFLLMALAASTTLVACDKSENSGSNPDKMPKGVTLTLPNINPQSRATGNAMKGGSQVELKNFKVFFVKADGSAVTDEELTYEGNSTAQKTYFSSDDEDWATITAAGKELTYHLLPYETTKVVVVGNIGNVEYTALADMTQQEVPNDTDAGHPSYQLYGSDDLTEGSAPDDKTHQNVYTASVTLAPRVSRFEIYGFQYERATGEGATNKYDHVKLQKIALNKYYTKYDFVTKSPVTNSLVSGEIDPQNAWTWIQDQQTPWSNTFIDYSLNPGDKKFADGTAITNDAETGDTATGIITYGLAHVTDKANNPELLLALYGVTTGGTEYPLYLHAKFQDENTGEGNNGAFVSGKIYRVFFSFSDTDLEQPQRCVELNVTVDNWAVVTVTPEF